MPYYTQILSQRSPTSNYNIEGDSIILIPNGSHKKSDLQGGYTLYDATNFYTNSKIEAEHIKLLRRFVIIYSFLLRDIPASMFDNGELINHIEIPSHSDVPTSNEIGRIKIDFDDLAGHIYFTDSPPIKISFSKLYKSTKEEFLDYFVLFLDNLSSRGRVNYSPDYFIFNHSYLQIVNYVTLLEILIGHSDDCEEIITECKVCGKKGVKHRKGSEDNWIKKYLNTVVKDDILEKSYFEIIDFARKRRNGATHDGKLPTAKYILQETHFEEYGFDRSKNEYKDNTLALSSIVINIGKITHYLMLNHYYSLNQFFPLKPLMSKTFGKIPVTRP